MPKRRWQILVEQVSQLAKEIGEVYDGPDMSAHRPATLDVAGDNPLLQAFLSWHDGPRGDDWTARGTATRDALVAKTAWAIPSEAALASIVDAGPVVEIGAGTGYWAALLAARGADVIAYDINPPNGDRAHRWHPGATTVTDVRVGGPEVLCAHGDRTLLLCWPPQESDMAARCLAEHRGSTVIYVGEWNTRTSATGAFFRALDRTYDRVRCLELPAWPSIGDRLYVFRRPD